MAEFSLVESETRLFEAASGTELHRDRTSNKVKFLPLGRWKGTLTEDDLPNECKYIAFSDHLDMLGPELYANFNKTRQVAGEGMVVKFRNTTGPWRIRRMPLTQRPWSSNTYLLPKVWYKAHIIPLRQGDIDQLKKFVNSFVFADQYEKPRDVTKYRACTEGGLAVLLSRSLL